MSDAAFGTGCVEKSVVDPDTGEEDVHPWETVTCSALFDFPQGFWGWVVDQEDGDDERGEFIRDARLSICALGEDVSAFRPDFEDSEMFDDLWNEYSEALMEATDYRPCCEYK